MNDKITHNASTSTFTAKILFFPQFLGWTIDNPTKKLREKQYLGRKSRCIMGYFIIGCIFILSRLSRVVKFIKSIT